MMHNLTSSPRILLLALLLFFGITCHAEKPSVGTITAAELSQRLQEPRAPVVLDVRTPGEYLSGHINGALNVPHDELERRLGEIPGDISSEIVVYCQSGRRAGVAEKILVEKGYTNIRDLAGHWQNWNARLK
ncbi:MAG: rhodanese-like domain-containing protein [Nitrosomonadaceae bacterium]|nr:rhodanese-like domain-containing protein [Nitrosomonadaceae bacterium]